MPASAPDPPAPLKRAGVLVALQGVALLLTGLGYALSGVLGQPENRLATVLAGGLGLLAGLALLPVARGLGAARGWALAPTVVTQVFVVVVATGLVQGHVYAVAVPLLVVAGAVLYQLATPESRAALRER